MVKMLISKKSDKIIDAREHVGPNEHLNTDWFFSDVIHYPRSEITPNGRNCISPNVDSYYNGL